MLVEMCHFPAIGNTYFLNRLPLMSLSFLVQGLMMSSEGET